VNYEGFELSPHIFDIVAHIETLTGFPSTSNILSDFCVSHIFLDDIIMNYDLLSIFTMIFKGGNDCFNTQICL